MKKIFDFKKAIFIMALCSLVNVLVNAQTIKVTGKVTEQGGSPLPGVNVMVEGTTIGVVTNIDGVYNIEVENSDAVLVFSYIGFLTENVKVAGQSTIDIILIEDIKNLEEVVVVGYGTQKKANLTGAVDMITSETLENRPISNVSEGLQGVIPNLNVTIFSGDPTESADLNVRGYESINGGSPLVLVDGVPMDLNRVNPQDIESITVLKDAAAGAIYGARAAFGVILVETKRGSEGIDVRLSTELTFDKPIFNLDPVENGYEYALLRNQAQTHGGGDAYYSPDYMEGLKKYWEDPENNPPWEMVEGSFRNYEASGLSKDLLSAFAPSQKYDLSISGSSEKANYYTSFGYLNKDGYINHNGNLNFKRYNILLKADFDVNKWLSIDQSITLNARTSDKPTEEDLNSFVRMEPIRPHVVPLIPGYEQWEGDYWDHPFNVLADYERGGRTTWNDIDTWLKTGVTLSPFNRFRIRTDFTYQLYNRKYQKNAPQYYALSYNLEQEDPRNFVGDDEIITRTNFNQYYVFNSYAEYLLDDITNHYVKMQLGFNQELGLNTSTSGEGKTLAASNIQELDATTGLRTAGGASSHLALRGVFYRFNYIFKDRYLFETNGRYDGTSRFAKDSRFGFFPSFSAGWRITEEPFMESITGAVLDYAKIRASYGELGNQLLGSDYYTYIRTMSVSQQNFVLNSGEIPVINIPGIVSPTLTWESVTTKNLGVDLGFFNQKLKATFDVYTRETKDMLMKKVYPSILGTSAPNENAADLKTSGWDLSVKWRDTPSGDFSYNVTFTLSDWISEITKYDNPTGSLEGLGSTNYYVGQRLGEIWGYETVGLIQDEEQLANMADQSRIDDAWRLGDIEYKDLDGDGGINTGENTLENPGDRKIIGNSNPRYSFGLITGAKYKDFSVSLFFQGIGKRDYYPSTGNWTWFFPWRSYNIDKSWVEDSWSEDNRDAFWPAPQYGNKNFQTQTKYLQNAAYIRLKNITLSYDLPQTLVQKIGIKGLKVYASGQNLWEFSKVRPPLDPEYIHKNSIAYPLMRSFSGGLIVNL